MSTLKIKLKCTICGNKFSNLPEHQKLKHISSQNITYTAIINDLQTYIKTYNSKSAFKCYFCPKICSRKVALCHHLKTHLNSEETICPFCEETKNQIIVLKHKNNVQLHLINFHSIAYHSDFLCNVGDCLYITKLAGDLRKHKKLTHKINVEWYHCDQNDCDKKFASVHLLKRHLDLVHRIYSNPIPCTVEGCTHIAKNNCYLINHKKYVHKINTLLYSCDVDGCNKEYVDKFYLKEHKQRAHQINITYTYCNQSDCNWKFIHTGDFNRHLSLAHDIGDHQCEFCLKNTNSCISYKNPKQKTSHDICRKCYNKVTGKHSRAEEQMSDFLNQDPTLKPFLLGSDKSFKSMGGCLSYRPDKLYASDNIVIHIECDEHQHQNQNGSYQCEDKRISTCYNEFVGKKYIVIRWNPDHYKRPDDIKTLDNRQKRLQKLSNLIHKILENPPNDLIYIYYMYYNKTNPQISSNFPHDLLY